MIAVAVIISKNTKIKANLEIGKASNNFSRLCDPSCLGKAIINIITNSNIIFDPAKKDIIVRSFLRLSKLCLTSSF